MSALFFKPKNCQPFSVPSQFHPKHFQVKLITVFFQLTRICFLYSMAFQHFLVILINNFVGQTTDKFTNLISIFKTQKKSSVMYLNILKSTAPGLTDFPLIQNHDLVYVSLFYSPLFCSINFLAIVSIPTLKRYFKHHGTMQFCKPMIVAKSTTQKSEFLVPSQFHQQHFQ